MHLLRSLAFLAPSLALLACAGHVEVIGGGDDGGSGDGNPAQECPPATQVDPGGSCSAAGLTCPSNLLTSCPNTHYGEQSVACTCSSGSWVCAPTGGGCPAPPGPCPDPSQVVQSSWCSTDPQLSCASNIPVPTCDGSDAGTVSCTCSSSSWQCPVFGGPLCPGEAGIPCPPPTSVYSGWACSASGVQCAGNPQLCGGTTVYDAFACESGAWVDIAQTVCDADGGPPADTGPPDSGLPVDAGVWDGGGVD